MRTKYNIFFKKKKKSYSIEKIFYALKILWIKIEQNDENEQNTLYSKTVLILHDSLVLAAETDTYTH